MKRLFASAALVAVSNLAVAACPTTVQLYHGSSWGEVFPDYVKNYHEIFILQREPGSVYNIVPTPKFSIAQPLKSAADLDRLTHEDWLKIVEYNKRSQDASPPRRRGDVPEQDAANEKAEKLSMKNFDAVVNCFLSKTAKSTSGKQSSEESVQMKSGHDRELTATETEERMIDSDAQMRAIVASRSKKEDADKYESQQSFLARQEGGGVKVDKHRAKIISPKCIQFKDYGTGVTSDVEKISSNCSVPVAVTYCFHRDGPGNGCSNKTVGWGTTGIIRPGGSRVVINPGKGERWRVDYYVCDMSDPDKVCLKP